MSVTNFLELQNITARRVSPVHGGDINTSWKIETSDGLLFLKENSASRYPGMFRLEQAGLAALANNTQLVVPQVLATGEEAGQQYLLMEWLETATPAAHFWEAFGQGLATMHLQTADSFGWTEANYIGSILQRNNSQDSWEDFYTLERILPLAQILVQQRKWDKDDMKDAERLCERLGTLFPKEPPALLHGDLWSGNFMCAKNHEAAVFDPAVYYGHREMDIAMTLLFGGFDRKFYDAYNAHYPLATGWQQRLKLCQLYPVMVHAILFGGHYVQQSAGIVKAYL